MFQLVRSLFAVTLLVAACTVPEEVGTLAQEGSQLQGSQLQGSQLQGSQLQGSQLQGSQLQGHLLGGMTLEGTPLLDARVERGELVGEQSDGSSGRTVLRGRDLEGVQLRGEAIDPTTGQVHLVDFRIAAIEEEDPAYDLLGTGHTWLYEVEEWVPELEAWLPICAPDQDGRAMAIPFGAVWDQRASRVESSDRFTFGCTTGALAKCYRWGYRPWVAWEDEPDLLRDVHQACSRMARADYCGTGASHTQDGTLINIWDDLSPAIQVRDEMGPGWAFEAAWNADGAACLSRTRWPRVRNVIQSECPERLGRVRAPQMCHGASEVPEIDPSARLFNESRITPR